MSEMKKSETDRKKKDRSGLEIQEEARWTEIGDKSCYFRLRDDAEVPS
jgi:hypothetical protein